ncbi:MAG TPA: glycosyltransferase [Acidimicrobiia bacterium]|nr:glycosyltransferase [Acidimicrobiia bacterium]
MRVAIVHEKFTVLAGSERVVEQLHVLFPDAPIFGSVLDRKTLPPGLADADVRPTGLQRLYRGGDHYAHLLPLIPRAMARIDVGDVDLVVTSHHAFANRVRVPGQIPVISYTHTPARWIWDPTKLADERGGALGRRALGLFARTQRRPDRAAARRLRAIIANSGNVADRIERWWGRSSTVVHPPVDVDWYTPDPNVAREDFFLLAGRLVPYKEPMVAVAAANPAGVRLVVAGEGRQLEQVRAEAGPRVEVLGRVNDSTLRDLYRRCRALVFPGEEDFGIVPVEAQACGAPVVARAVGGGLETVADTTGVLYPAPADRPGAVGALADALRAFDPDRFDSEVIRRRAESFSPEHFRRGFFAEVERAL